jgi:hypothetical protein
MIAQDPLLVQLVRLIYCLPAPPQSAPPQWGRPPLYSDTLFLKALVIMIVRRLHRPGELLAVLQEPTAEMRSLRQMLHQDGRFPSRRTGLCPPREGSTLRASPLERSSSTSWRCSTVTSEIRARTMGSKPFSEPLERL